MVNPVRPARAPRRVGRQPTVLRRRTAPTTNGRRRQRPSAAQPAGADARRVHAVRAMTPPVGRGWMDRDHWPPADTRRRREHAMSNAQVTERPAPPASREQHNGRRSRSGQMPHLTAAELRRQGRRPGRACRGPRTPSGKRTRTGLIRSSCWRSRPRTRVPELVPLRYGRMLLSAFTFFRGARRTWLGISPAARGAAWTQLCGDAHCPTSACSQHRTANARVQGQRLRRDAAGSVRVGRETARGELRSRGPAADWGRSTQDAKAVLATVRAYRQAMQRVRGGRASRGLVRAIAAEEPRRARDPSRYQDCPEAGQAVEHNKARRSQGQPEGVRTSSPRIVDGRIRFVSVPPLIVPVEEAPGGASNVRATSR